MTENKSKRFPGALVLLALVSCGFVMWACSPGGDSGERKPVTVAMVRTELNALFYVAEAKRWFAANGLEVTFRENYDSGAAAAEGMLKGEADMALAAEFPVVRQVFDRRDITGFGTVARYENTYIVWHAGRGIETLRDLEGGRIGVTLKTISEFYLGRALELNGMRMQQVTLVDTRAADSGKRLADGDIDAVVTWEPWVDRIRQRMGTKVVVRVLQSGQYAFWNLVGTRAWAQDNADTLKRLLKSLVQAENHLVVHNDEARAIVAKRVRFDDAYLETIWPRYQFTLSLDHSLILAMEDEARWMIKNGLTTETEVPDFIDHVFETVLESVKPEAVHIIR